MTHKLVDFDRADDDSVVTLRLTDESGAAINIEVTAQSFIEIAPQLARGAASMHQRARSGPIIEALRQWAVPSARSRAFRVEPIPIPDEPAILLIFDPDTKVQLGFEIPLAGVPKLIERLRQRASEVEKTLRLIPSTHAHPGGRNGPKKH